MPPPSPATQRTHEWPTSAKLGERERQAKPLDEEMWAARARALGRSASSQLSTLQRLSLQPRTLPPRPTALDKAAVDEGPNALHGLLEQMQSRHSIASISSPSPTVLRSETQRFGLEKRRNMRRKAVQGGGGGAYLAEAQDLDALEEWLREKGWEVDDGS